MLVRPAATSDTPALTVHLRKDLTLPADLAAMLLDKQRCAPVSLLYLQRAWQYNL
jgi:hypothetical protein